MKPATIATLRVGDRVRSTEADNALGTVAGFGRDFVSIAWDFGDTWRYSDDGLRGHNVVKCSPFDAEDTIP